MQPSATRDVHILDTIPIISPLELVNELPVTSAVEHTVEWGREQTRNILNGTDPRLFRVCRSKPQWKRLWALGP